MWSPGLRPHAPTRQILKKNKKNNQLTQYFNRKNDEKLEIHLNINSQKKKTKTKGEIKILQFGVLRQSLDQTEVKSPFNPHSL